MPALQPDTFRLPVPPPPSAVSMPLPAAGRDSPPDQRVTRWLWHGRFGTILIEVRGDEVFVDGERVEPHAP